MYIPDNKMIHLRIMVLGHDDKVNKIAFIMLENDRKSVVSIHGHAVVFPLFLHGSNDPSLTEF